MKFNKMRHLIGGIIFIILTIVSSILLVNKGFSIKYFITFLVSLLGGIFETYMTFSKKEEGNRKKLLKEVDERDLYIVAKSAQLTIQIINIILFTITIISIILYGITKNNISMIVTIILSAISLTVFLISLIIQSYYEKKL